ncbi:MAG: hypothetical protein IJ690_01975 [Clostridia bacterium]|nr:hypothetical protein [Clostridia bacterium]MBR1653709.1 hypothetical protein [Clostridia bacterium]
MNRYEVYIKTMYNEIRLKGKTIEEIKDVLEEEYIEEVMLKKEENEEQVKRLKR